MNILSQDMVPLDKEQETDTHLLVKPIAKALDPELIDYESQREPLWDIHQFVEKVLATDKPGFDITIGKWGRKIYREFSLARHYPLIHNYIARIPLGSEPSRYIGLFQRCCIEMNLVFDRLGKPGDIQHGEMIGAEYYNTFLDLIRLKSRTIPEYIGATRYATNYDPRIFKSIRRYVDGLFQHYCKLLVVRLDVEYRKTYSTSVTFDQAQRDISRFISHRRWSKAFKHSVGFVIAREHGKRGACYHFHVFVFFDGNKQMKDGLLAKAIGKYYWTNQITRITQAGEKTISRGKHFNCNAKRDEYKHDGIGMIDYRDEVKRAENLYALLYLTKNSQELAKDAPPRAKSVTKGVLPRRKGKKPGPRRQIRANNRPIFRSRAIMQTKREATHSRS